MDESNATSVSAPPDQVAERSEAPREYPPREMTISIVTTTRYSGHHVSGLLLDLLEKRGLRIETIRIQREGRMVSSYNRRGGANA